MPSSYDVPSPDIEYKTVQEHNLPTPSTVLSSDSDQLTINSMIDGDDTSTLDFPLPGGLPLLPPFRSNRHTSNAYASNSPKSAQHSVAPSLGSSSQHTVPTTANTFGFGSPRP